MLGCREHPNPLCNPQPRKEGQNTVTRLAFLLILVLALLPVGCEAISPPSSYTEASFAVEPGQKHTVAVQLREGHTVEGSFSISGADNFIDFYIKGPNGELAYGVVRAVGAQSFETTAETEGAYTLYFDNSISWGRSRQISLRYRVR